MKTGIGGMEERVGGEEFCNLVLSIARFPEGDPAIL